MTMTMAAASAETRRSEHERLVSELADTLRATALGGSASSRERHVARGKLLPRDRVNELLDPGSPFLEIAPLAANGLYDDESPGAGIITGIGRVSGREHQSCLRTDELSQLVLKLFMIGGAAGYQPRAGRSGAPLVHCIHGCRDHFGMLCEP